MADYNLSFTPEELATEEWRIIPSFHAYEISSLGRVRRGIAGPRTRKGNLLKPSRSRSGYMRVTLYYKAQGVKFANIHRLVAEAFLGPCPETLRVDHVDGNKSNNRASNLEYVTNLENHRRAVRLGLTPDRKGTELPWAKLTESDIPQIRKSLRDGETCTAIAKRFGVDRTTINFIKLGKIWKHIP